MLEQIKEINFKNLNYAAKKQIIKGLTEQKDKDACHSIVEFLYDENKSVQELAMDSLIRIGSREVVENLLPLLEDNEARVRNIAMEIIQEIAFDNTSLLTPLLKDPRESIRIYVANLLGLIGNPKAVEPLVLSLQDPSANVRSSALAGLGKLGDDKAIEAIEELLQTEKELWVIFSSIKSLENIGGQKAVQILLDLLTRKDEFILAATIESLGEIGNMNTVGPILQNVSNPSENIIERINTAFMAILQRETGTTTLTEQDRANLISFFSSCARSDVNTWTRFRAIELLGRLRAKESLNILAEIAQNAPPMLQIAAAKAMGNIGGDEAKKLLKQLSESEDSNIQTAAQESLKRLN